MSLTIIIIIITALISIAAFRNPKMLQNLMLWPFEMRHPSQYYRFITSGFVHVDEMHLAFNMISFYFFGTVLEPIIGAFWFGLLYITAIIVCDMPSFFKHHNNPRYASLGASGGVAAIIFATIYLYPWQQLGILFIPYLKFPAIFFAILYLVYSAYMDRKGRGRIAHGAHFWGSVYGLAFMLIVLDQSHGVYFWEQISNPPPKFGMGY
jgi:membrane associated rhomboid family serine protease